MSASWWEPTYKSHAFGIVGARSRCTVDRQAANIGTLKRMAEKGRD